MPPKKLPDKIFKSYKSIDGALDPEKSHSDIKF